MTNRDGSLGSIDLNFRKIQGKAKSIVTNGGAARWKVYIEQMR